MLFLRPFVHARHALKSPVRLVPGNYPGRLLSDGIFCRSLYFRRRQWLEKYSMRKIFWGIILFHHHILSLALSVLLAKNDWVQYSTYVIDSCRWLSRKLNLYCSCRTIVRQSIIQHISQSCSGLVHLGRRHILFTSWTIICWNCWWFGIAIHPIDIDIWVANCGWAPIFGLPGFWWLEPGVALLALVTRIGGATCCCWFILDVVSELYWPIYYTWHNVCWPATRVATS